MDERDSLTTTGTEIGKAYEKHYKVLILRLTHMVHSTEDAKDILQSVFMELIKKPGDGSPYLALLKTICHNRAIDFIRRRNRFPNVDLAKAAAQSNRQEDSIDFENRDLLYSGMEAAKFKKEHLQLVELLKQKVSVREIAETLGMTAKQVTTRKRYIIGKLREVISGKDNLISNR